MSLNQISVLKADLEEALCLTGPVGKTGPWFLPVGTRKYQIPGIITDLEGLIAGARRTYRPKSVIFSKLFDRQIIQLEWSVRKLF